MANDVTQLQAAIEALEAKASETNSTLAGLAQEVVALKGQIANLPPDIQPQLDALTAKAETILAGLTAAEDAADDQLPPVA